jgi:RHS repeat-associated protein
VLIQQPANNSAFPAGGPVLVSGAVAPGGAPISQVTLNGGPATVDAAGDFFSQVTPGQGQSTYTVTATDSAGQSGSSSVTVTGNAPVPAGQIDFSLLSDVTPSFTPSYGRTSFNDGTHVIYADLSATNTGNFAIDTPLLVGVRNISAPSVRVRDNDGVTPTGMPYYDYSKLIAGGTVKPNGSIGTRAIAFYDPEGVQFTYQLVFLGALNKPPRFVSAPRVQWVLGGGMGGMGGYSYQAQAVDPDAAASGETLTYSLVYGPQQMQINSSTGLVTWSGQMPSAGTYAVGIKVADGRGLSAEQDYVITVSTSPVQTPPHFITDPVVDANVDTPYTYASLGADQDNDFPFTYSILNGPAGMTINSFNGVVTWTPTSAQLGVQNVTLQVKDMAQLVGTQTYQILVQDMPGNYPPIITTTAPLTVAAGQTYVYPVHAVDSDAASSGETLIYSLQPGAPTAMTIDQLAGGISWVTTTNDIGPHTVTVQVADGRGGVDTQTFIVTVTAASGAGSIYGMKWNDLNANGIRDAAYINTPPTTLQPIDLQPVPLTHTPITIMYHQPTNSALIATFLNSSPGPGEIFGSGTLLERVLADGTEIPFATLPDVTLGDGIQMTTVQAGNTAGFTVGDVFAPVAGFFGPQQTDGRIVRVTNNGATVADPWVTLPLVQGQVTELYMDTTGAFGDNLLALTSQGEMWEIDSTGHATVLVPSGVVGGDGAFLVVPNNATTYGPLAGKILAISDGATAVTIDPQGNVTQVPALGANSGEGIALIPATGNLFALADGDSNVYMAAGQQFAPIQGQIVTAQESGSMSRVYFDGTQLQDVPLTFTDPTMVQHPWEQLEMFPAPLGPAGLTLEPGLPNWTITLTNTGTGVVSSTKTDANGNYSFTGLQPGTYTVGEVQQTGWQQTAPPGGTYTVALAANQTVTGQDFGNHHIPTGPNGIPVITSNPVTSVVAGSTYLYNVVASDTDGDPLTFDVPVAPNGMAADKYGGVVGWKPTAADRGIHTVLLRVQDGRGGVALQSFQVSVTLPNTPPVITSTAPTPAVANQPYQYIVTAQDAEQLPSQLRYHLDGTPVGNMNLDPITGVFTWTPQTADIGPGPTVTLDVNDGQGGDTFQTFTLPVVAPGANQAPAFTSSPRTSIQINQEYVYEAKAGDADGDALTFGFGANHPTGMSINPVTGVVSWRPTAAQFGPNLVDVQVDDHRGSVVTQEFTVTVTDNAANQPPVITSSPVLTATAAQAYAYNAKGYDPNGDPLSWSLTAAPLGMSIDPNLGYIRWTPTDDQVGTQAVTVRAVDPEGGFATQSYTITVRGENLPPVITSTPVFQVGTGQAYSYAVVAHDDDGDPLTYSLPTTDPAGMQVSATGLITWTAPTTPGSFPVEVDVSDGFVTVAQSWTLTVSAPVDLPPAITSRPPTVAMTGVPYSYQVTAVDPDGDTSFTYSLLTAPPNMNISSTGLITWTPGQFMMFPFVQVQVKDSANNIAQQFYQIHLVVNQLPQIYTQPVTSAVALTPYQYDVGAIDPDGDGLTYAVSGTPTSRGMSIDAFGRLTWSPGLGDVGSYAITVTVTDAFGASTPQNFTLTVTRDTTPPTVELQLSPNSPVVMGTQETFLVFASDDVGVASTTLTVNGVNVPLDAQGQGFMTMSTPGFYNVVATATDTSGNVSPPATATLQVTNPNAQAPTINLNNLPNGGVVTAPETVSGTITDVANYTYTITAVPFDNSPTITLASGSGTPPGPNSFSATFDPTLLPNGDYTINVSVQDNNGNSATASQQVHVQGRLKLGDFTLTFTDLTVPVSGIPISITRTYNTLNANKNLDFGYGWQQGYGDPQLKVDLVPGAGIGWGGYPAFLDGTRVYVTRPGGDPEGFTFMPYQEGYDPFGLITYWHPFFLPDQGVYDSLNVQDALLSKDPDSGEYYSIEDTGLDTYNPADPNYGGAYTIKNVVGIGYTVDANSGKLLSASDRNGNELSFSDTGITSNSGRAVTFTRDPQGRITSITDPRGNSVVYAYTTSGDLASMTDRAGDLPTTFQYTASQAHYLTAIVDGKGNKQMNMTFAADGRLSQIKDVAGNVLNYGYDLTNLKMTSTDPANNNATTTTTYNSVGNPTQVQDGAGQVTKATYSNDLPTSVTQVGADGNHTTQYSYDASGNPRSITDPNGNVTRYTYGPDGEVQTMSDPLGNTLTNQFDDKGNLVRTTSAEGLTATLGYDSHGNLSSITQATGVTQLTHDSFGQLVSATDPSGVTSQSSYDANGNQTGTQMTWVNPSNPNDVHTLTTAAGFDGNDRVTSTTDERGNHTQTKFDTLGRVWRTIDERGGNTDTLFDIRNEAVQTTRPDGTVTRTVYNPEGEATYTTDAFVPGGANDPPHVTRTVYDADGRPVATERWANVIISLTQDAAGNSITAAVVADGRPFDPNNLGQYGNLPPNQQPVRLSVTSTAFDSLGRVSQETDAAGLVTQYGYDAAGRQTSTVLVLPNGHQITSAEAYDAAGRVVSTTDPLNHTTQSAYDGDGRLTLTTFADGTTVAYGYDVNGRRTSVTDQLGRTTNFEYDAQGRLTAVVQPAVTDPGTGQPVRPRTQYTYDKYGDLLTQKDALGRVTQYTYDPFGDKTSRILPQGQGDTSPPTETMTYDAFGQLSTHTDFVGNVTVYHYDPNLGRVTEEDLFTVGHNPATSPPDQQIKTQYDPLGRVSQVTDSAYGALTYGYDADGRLTSVMSPEGEVDYGYDPTTGRHTSTTTANTGIQYGYDALGRLTSVHLVKSGGVNLVAAGTDQTQSYTYDDANNLIHTELDQGASVVATADYAYDSLNRLQTLVQKNGAGAQSASYTYKRLADGNVSEVDESLLLPSGSTRTDTVKYAYDALGRLTEEALTSSDATLNRTADYTLDLVGNRLKEVLTTPGQTQTTTDAYDARDRLLTSAVSVNGGAAQTTNYGYDVNGNLTGVTNPDGSTVAYVFDLQGRTVQATAKTSAGGVLFVEQLTYGPDGIRTGSAVTQGGTTTTSRYLIDGQNPTGYAQVLEELTGSGALAATYLQGLMPISLTRGGQTSYYLLDGHSGVRLLTDATGRVTDAYTYDAFGNLLTSAGATVNPLLYRGEWLDSRLGEYFLRARWYDTVSGRFTRADSFDGFMQDPRSLNKYVYAQADPVNGRDPSGRFLIGGLSILLGSMTSLFLRGSKMSTYSSILGKVYLLFGNFAIGAIGGLLSGLVASGVLYFNFSGTPIWSLGGSLPTKSDNIPNARWKENVSTTLKNFIDAQPGLTAAQQTNGKNMADAIAEAYVNAVRSYAVRNFNIEDSDQVMFGKGGQVSDWWGNWIYGEACFCRSWADAMRNALAPVAVANKNSGWRLKIHQNVPLAGDLFFGIPFQHNFISITWDPTGQSTRDPDFILDPWPRARPDIFRYRDTSLLWPVGSAEVTGEI